MEGKIAAHKERAHFGRKFAAHMLAGHKASFAAQRYRAVEALESRNGAGVAAALHSFEALGNSRPHRQVCRKFAPEPEAGFAEAQLLRRHKRAAEKMGFGTDNSTLLSELDSWAGVRTGWLSLNKFGLSKLEALMGSAQSDMSASECWKAAA